MKLGVDFGTTRIVVAAADRGNYPLVSFDAPDGQSRDWFPPLIAVGSEGLRFGWEASLVHGDPEWTVIRSIKRLLKTAGLHTELEIGGKRHALFELLVELLLALRQSLWKASTLRVKRGDLHEVMIGVPANANSNQRFLTAEAFRAAGFQVLGMMNEPSAASVEYGHRDRAARKSAPDHHLLVYDLGGGTFDASLVRLDDAAHTVIGTAGVPDVGGDDFDEILADMAIEAAPDPAAGRDSLTAAEWFRLCEECRERKEALNPNTRRIVVDLDRGRNGWGEVTIAAADYYERCRPLIERTESAVAELLEANPGVAIDALYVTGGGSELPAVARVLKETHGRRVRRSAYMRSATAIGLAIGADDRSGYALRDRFARSFGVWRETDGGRSVVFDLLFPAGLELPRTGAAPLRAARAYRPVHNIGHFRYVECSRVDDAGQPAGDLSMWDDIRFPFDPRLRDTRDLRSIAVSTSSDLAAQWVEEEYTCDSGGNVRVTIANQTAGYRRAYSLGRWSGGDTW
jgi:molecular chaperone DnaK (HSP70)